MKHVMIISGGHINDDFAISYIQKEKPSELVAADSGLNFFYRNGLLPDLAVGDFDSVEPEVLSYFKSKDQVTFETLIPEKDDTDTEHTIRSCIKRGATRISLLGASGSRLDHVFGNISLLGIGIEEGIELCMVDEHNRIRMVQKHFLLGRDKQYGDYISLFPFLGPVEGLCVRGVKYPLEDYLLAGFNSLGVSNEILEECMEIDMKKGTLLVMETKD